jgi:3-oxoacyl-[acyl-carrier-protein] synthase-1
VNFSINVSAWERSGAEEICVVGVGARTCVGSSAATTAAAVRGGISGLALHPTFVDITGEPVSFAADPILDPDAPVETRLLAMLRSVTEEALAADSSGATVPPDCCLLALPEPRAGLPAGVEARLAAAQAQDLGLAPDAVRTLQRGHAGGLMALQAAAQWLSQGEFQALLVVGVDSYHDRQTLRALEVQHRLKSSKIRGGFPPGEAAGACLLVRGAVANRAGLRSLLQIRSAATAVEPHPLRATEACLGEGLTAAIASVVQNLVLPQEQITLSYCDLNGERFRNEEFVFAQMRTQDAFVDANNYLSPADCWGDVGAASGPLFVALAAASKLRGYAKGSRPLLWAGSDSGYRCAVALALEPIAEAAR